jgi:hypothetical protein
MQSNILYGCLLPVVGMELGGYQAGFSEGKSNADQIFTLRQILEINI